MYQRNGEPSSAVAASAARIIDLRSDTITKPTAEMRRAMAEAVVGDDVFGEDPTVIELQQRCAKLFAKEAALFVPSGTMANLLAILVHCNQRGAECIVGDQSHVHLYEQAGAAQFAGVQLSCLPNLTDGTFSLDAFRQRIRGDDPHEPTTQMSVVENTHNMCGGKVLPLWFLDQWTALCRANGIRSHMDGARIFNAAAASGETVARIVRDLDSVCFCLSKGLSAPVGSVLLGSAEFIKKAHRLRKALGGGLRQVGVLAAAGLCSLDHIVSKLGDDHRRTLQIAEAIHATNSQRVRVDIDHVPTNILLIELSGGLTPDMFIERLAEVKPDEVVTGLCDSKGCGLSVLVGARDSTFVRLVMHHQISDEECELIVKKIVHCIGEWDETVKNGVQK